MTAQSYALPEIVISRSDHSLLSQLASAGADAAETLLDELERARIVDDESLPPNVVRLGSTAGYVVDDADPATATLVLPEHADVSKGQISILTPIGTALIGLRPGQSIRWITRDGRERTLTVITVFSAGNGNAQPAETIRRKPWTMPDLPDDPGPSAA